jgi:tetratricopeptide (TPR) repeat protein
VSANPQAEVDSVDGLHANGQPKVRLRWDWNISLLVKSLCVVGVVSLVVGSLYFWQSSRMASELLSQASSSKEQGKIKEHVKWLTKYVRLVPGDVENLAQLALAVDSQEVGESQNVELARSKLSLALAACGENDEFVELSTSLRRKLIPRLLQFGVMKAAEAEKQILLLATSSDDTEVMKWLAQSLVFQRSGSEFKPRDPFKYDKQTDYWSWLASQPAGEILRMAVEANPDDLDLTSSLLAACSEGSTWFDLEGEAASKEKLFELRQNTLARLAEKKESGHAQYIVYFYTAISDQAKARSFIATALEPALARLNLHLGSSGPSDVATNEGESAIRYEPRWDWQIALESAKLRDGVEAVRICENLIKLATGAVDTTQREEAFLRLAALKMAENDFEAALEICKSGLTMLPQSSALNRSIAVAYLKLSKPAEARLAIDEFDRNVELRFKQLDGELGTRMSIADKASVRKQISYDQWSSLFLNGQLAFIEKNYVKATKLLKSAYATAISVDVEDRVQAGLLLAACYAKAEQWDLVGQIYGACSVLKPKDKFLRLGAADAWRRVGAHGYASEQLNGVDDGSFSTALARALTLEKMQSSKAERKAMVDAIRDARQKLNDVPVDQQASLEPWRLELLELRAGIGAEEIQPENRIQGFLSKLESLAERYADIADVQAQSAVDFAAAGNLDLANLAIKRLEEIATRSKSIDDRAKAVLTKASVRIISKDSDGAVNLLLDAIREVPEQAAKFAKAAAEIEMRASRLDQAYAALCLVPEGQLDFETVNMLALIADGSQGDNAGKAREISSRFENWAKVIRQVEGEDGTNWRYLEAMRLVIKYKSQTNSTALLEDARRYIKDIELMRSNWYLSAALGGKLASLRGDSAEAIRLWKRALDEGDTRISTVFDLVKELNLVKREDEAEAELQRLSSLADSFTSISALEVSYDLKRGDFSEALARTERLTSRNPEDIDSWLLRAQTTFAASSSLGLEDDSKSKLRDKCWEFLEKAHQLSLGKEIRVWDARFRFKTLTGDKAGAVKVLEELVQSALPGDSRFYEAGQRYLVLKEFGTARECFENSLLVNARFVEAYLGLADLHNAIGDEEESIQSLRKALQIAPKNALVRERLAMSLAFSGSAKSAESEKINWSEIDSLLTSLDESNSTRATFVGALIALSKGDQDRQQLAIQTLKGLTKSLSAEGVEAKRLLASFYSLKCFENAESGAVDGAYQNFESALGLYEELLARQVLDARDAAQFASLLISFVGWEKENTIEPAVDHLVTADRVLKQLESATGSSVASLQLRIRLAKVRGEEAAIGEIAEKWVAEAGALETLGMQNVWEITGQTLRRLGRPQDAIIWIEKVYQKDPKKLELFVNALAADKQYQRAVELCMKSYASEPSATAARLIPQVSMMENATMESDRDLPQDALKTVNDALAKFPKSAELHEEIATFHLMQRRYPEAVGLFEVAEKLDPKRVRTLNNLAMALVEMPMRQQEAVAKIEKAIAIQGRLPDLLDTLGQVLLRSNRIEESIAVLNEACDQKNDVSFRIHLTQSLLAKKDIAKAKQQWLKINENREGVLLTFSDKELLNRLDTQFGEGQ